MGLVKGGKMRENKEAMVQFILVGTISAFVALLGVMIGALICHM